MTALRRILIANRGEIARRIARTCRRLGVEYACVYSDADRRSLHLEGAVEAVALGGSAPIDTYLDIGKLLQAARTTGCDAIHPGYGFLSENAEFAARVEGAGLIFVGPRADTIALLGDKASAKRAMAAAGVPTLPGSDEATTDLESMRRTSREVGFPVVLKPTAGGGGQGMQVVREPNGLRPAAERAIRLALANFKDGRLIVERYVDSPRHVEVQVFGDGQGHAVHMFERECSLQRRHQKVIEEAPAVRLTQDVRERMLRAAVRGAESIRYRNAGTFEFIADDRGECFFLEVNTRLQVEHPVSEEITGLDFVEWQLRIAGGEALPLAQSAIRAAGAAIEARIYAEDPARAFEPAPGRAVHVRWPDHCRVESAIASGDDIPSFYDPLIAKLVCKGEDRGAALAAMERALCACEVLGLTTNIGFLSRVIADDAVRRGDFHTRSLDQRADELTRGAAIDAVVAAAAATEILSAPRPSKQPWSGAVGLLDRSGLQPEAPAGAAAYWDGDQVLCTELHYIGNDHIVTSRGIRAQLDARDDGPVKRGRVDGQPFVGRWAPDVVELMVAGDRFALRPYPSRTASAPGVSGAAVAPMHGVVVAVGVAPGAHVTKGQMLAVIEAMKVENRVVAPRDGVVATVLCAVGDQVATSQALVTFADAPAPTNAGPQ